MNKRLSGKSATNECLLKAYQGAEHGKENETEPFSEIQGKGGHCSIGGRKEFIRVGRAIRTTPQPDSDLKALYTMIGQLTLENDFVAGTLNKAGLLSAGKRGTRLRGDYEPSS